MSRIEHHPHEDTLLSYSAGSLPAALALVVGCHLQSCSRCRSQVRAGEELGGELMSALTPKSLSERARDNVLKMLEQQVQGSNSTGSVDFMASGSVEKTPRATAMPTLLVNLLNADDFDALPWKKTIAPGLKQIVLDCDEGQARLLRIAAGQKMPVHSHRGNELTLILRGGYSDAVGEFHAGDVADLDGCTEHQPVAFDDMDCICLAGMDAPLAFKGWLAKLIQPFVGM